MLHECFKRATIALRNLVKKHILCKKEKTQKASEALLSVHREHFWSLLNCR